MKIIKGATLRSSPGVLLPLRLKPVKMKNSLYLLIPKGISELLELSELSECTLATEKEGQNPILKYVFHEATEVSHESGKDRRHSKQGKAWQKARRLSPSLALNET